MRSNIGEKLAMPRSKTSAGLLLVSLIVSSGPLAAQTCALDLAHPILIPKNPKLPRDTAKHAYKLDDASVVFLGRLEIDADGSPRAYGPANKGLDDTADAGSDGNWYALATDAPQCAPSGKPLVQKDGDPSPGYYVSRTSMTSGESCRDPRSYVDAETIPFVALPKAIATATCQGRLVAVNANGATKMAMQADDAPAFGYGEASIALAKDLGINSNPRSGGLDRRSVVYVVFQRRMGFPDSAAEVRTKAQSVFDKWGGTARLAQCREALKKAPP